MSNIAYFDCYSGASGDMLLGSMLDKAVDFSWFYEEIQKLVLPKDSFKLEKTYLNRSSINSCKIKITLNHKEHFHSSYNTICKIIDDSKIKTEAKTLAKNIFHKLGTAEAAIHKKPLDEIHFHEVGDIDSIIDIVGFSICFAQLKIDKCIVSPLPVGSGKVNCTHGCLPVPAPATLEILKDHNIIINNNEYIKEECLTPTAAAILCTVLNECSYFPNMDKIISIGYGAGDKVFHPNVTSNLRFILGKLNTLKHHNEIFFSLEAISNSNVSNDLLKELNSFNIIKQFITKASRNSASLEILNLECHKKDLFEIINKLEKSEQFEFIKYYETNLHQIT